MPIEVQDVRCNKNIPYREIICFLDVADDRCSRLKSDIQRTHKKARKVNRPGRYMQMAGYS